MAKRKREFVWEEGKGLGEHTLWCDEKHIERIKSLWGVVRVYIYLFAPAFGIVIDPRYDEKEVKATIEAVIKQKELPERKRAFVWQNTHLPETAFLWCKAKHLGAIRAVAGVVKACTGNDPGKYFVIFNPCYDEAEVIAEIERVITEGDND